MSYVHRGNRPKGRPFEAAKLRILLGQIEAAKSFLAKGETRWLKILQRLTKDLAAKRLEIAACKRNEYSYTATLPEDATQSEE